MIDPKVKPDSCLPVLEATKIIEEIDRDTRELDRIAFAARLEIAQRAEAAHALEHYTSKLVTAALAVLRELEAPAAVLQNDQRARAQSEALEKLRRALQGEA